MRSKMTRDEIVNSNSLEAQAAAREIAEGLSFISKAAIDGRTANLNQMGRSYYCFCLEQALVNIQQARALVKGDVTETNHELPQIERLITEALEVS